MTVDTAMTVSMASLATLLKIAAVVMTCATIGCMAASISTHYWCHSQQLWILGEDYVKYYGLFEDCNYQPHLPSPDCISHEGEGLEGT